MTYFRVYRYSIIYLHLLSPLCLQIYGIISYLCQISERSYSKRYRFFLLNGIAHQIGANGYTFSLEDSEEAVEKINRIISDVKLRESMEEESYRMIQAHRIEKSVFRLEKIYESLLAYDYSGMDKGVSLPSGFSRTIEICSFSRIIRKPRIPNALITLCLGASTGNFAIRF